MTRFPSVDTIESVCSVDRETAIKVRHLLDGRDNAESYASAQRRIAECYNRPSDLDLILTAVDELLGTCGIEAIRSDVWDRYYGDTVALYANTGDSYAGTILFDVDRGTFYATSWADWVETAESNGRYKFQ